MDSVVNICNLALARLGDSATVASIDPPEGSAQAEHCARFYPIARDTLLVAHPWNFAVKTARLAQLAQPIPPWAYTYTLPNDALSVIDVTDANANKVVEYHQEQLDTQKVLSSSVPDLLAHYIAKVSDAALFPPLFTEALIWKLAGLLAGPVIKGDSGIQMAQQADKLSAQYLQLARTEDSNQRRIRPRHDVSWIVGR